jgi:CheY-like chemotaxis protein
MTDAGSHPARPAQPTAGDVRVLVIDDDAAIGSVIARLLKPTPVVFAQSATGALGRIEAGGRFTAILCDFDMPGMNGAAFYEAVAARSDALASRIVFVTASSGNRELAELLRRTGCRCIEKPFQGAELRAAVAGLAARTGG